MTTAAGSIQGDLCDTKYQFGAGFFSLNELLEPEFAAYLVKKFSETNDTKAFVHLLECVRFLHLSIFKEGALFFPGNQLVDDIWHAMILETARYRNFCERQRPGFFLDHSGIKYPDYCASSTPESVIEEQYSWLASYVINFGDITESAFGCLPLAQTLSERLGISRVDLNELARRMAGTGDSTDPLQRFEDVICGLYSLSERLDSDNYTLNQSLHAILKSCGGSPTSGELRTTFECSTALGFQLWQHCAALERLERLSESSERVGELLKRNATGTVALGLGTTHLMKRDRSLTVTLNHEGNFLVSGILPWTSGMGICSDLILGVKDPNDDVLIFLLEYPSIEIPQKGIECSRLELASICSTSTVALRFDRYEISRDRCVDLIERSPAIPRLSKLSRYILPELGIAIRILKYLDRTLDRVPSDRLANAAETIAIFRQGVDSLVKSAADATSSEQVRILNVKKDLLIQNLIQAASLIGSGRDFINSSPVARAAREIQLLNAVIQSTQSYNDKLVAYREAIA